MDARRTPSVDAIKWGVVVDLGKMISVLWARKVLVAIGILVGIAASFLAVNAVQFSMDADKPFFSYSPRVQTVYSTTLRMVLDEPNFGLGRVGIINRDERRENRDLSKLAAVYSYLVVSDELTANLTRNIKSINGEIKATPVENLPIIEVTVKGNDPREVRKIASKAAANFIDYFKNEQVRNEVRPSDRITVRTIGEPSPAATEQSRRKELAFIFFMLPVAFAALLAFVLENIRHEKASENTESATHHANAKPLKRPHEHAQEHF